MSSKVQAATASQTITLATALDNVKKVFESVLSKEGQKFYLGHNFQLLSNPPRKEDAPTYEELLAELKAIVSIASDTKPEKQIKAVLGLIFKQANPKDKKEAKKDPTADRASVPAPQVVNPTHVAASSFQATVQAFLAQPAPQTKQDVKVPAPASRKKSVKPSVDLAVLKAVTEPVFAKHRVKLTKAEVYNANTNDFGMRIRTLRCSKPHETPMDKEKPKKSPSLGKSEFTFHFGAKNLQDWGKKLGFDVVFPETAYYLRDNLFRRADDSISTCTIFENGKPLDFKIKKEMQDGKSRIIFSVSEDVHEKFKIARHRHMSRALYCLSDPLFFTSHDHFEGTSGLSYAHGLNCLYDMRSFTVPASTNFYFEGGNLFKTTHPKDPQRRKLFIGEMTFDMAFHQMRLDKQFDNFSDEIESMAKQIQKNLTKEQVCEIAKEMFTQGLLKINGKDGLFNESGFGITVGMTRQIMLREKTHPGKKEGNPFVKVAVSQNFVAPFPSELTESQIKDATPRVARYLAQREMLKRLFGHIFISIESFDEEDLHILPQLDYHLDVFMRPGPNGSMFLQDYSLCESLLKQIYAKRKELNLSKKDIEILLRYIKTAEQLAKDLAPLFAKAKAEIEKAGYTVIPTPGIFYDISKKDLDDDLDTTYNLNFLNSITGFSDKINSYYYLTAGAKVGDNLGFVLMKCFEQFLNQYEKIQVGFIGHDPEDETDFSEAMNWLGTNCQAGPHCFSFEQVTSAYIPKKS